MLFRPGFVCLVLILLQTGLRADNYNVVNTSDTGPGSLRQAILDANANPGADLIRFAPAAQDGIIALERKGQSPVATHVN